MSNSLTAVIGADTSGFEKAIGSANNLLKKYQANAKKASKEIEENSSVSDRQVNAYKRVVSQLEKVNSGTMDSTKEHKALKREIRELKMQFDSLTNEAKKGEFGRSVSASLKAAEARYKQLGQQINATDTTIKNNNQTGKSSKNVFDSLKGTIGLNVTSFAKLGGTLGVATGALNLAKDAILHTEGAMDEWARTTASAEAGYNVLLDTLNSGDWTNFFNNIADAITDARELADQLDRAGSVRANNQWTIAMKQTELERIKAMRDSGQKTYNGEDINRVILRLSNALTTLKNQGANADLMAGQSGIISILKRGGAMNEVSAKLWSRQIREKGQGAFDDAQRIVDKLDKKWERKTYMTTTMTPSGPVQTPRFVEKFQGSSKELASYKAAKAMVDRESELQKYIGMVAQANTEIANNMREGGRYRRQATASSRGGSGKTSTKPSTDAINFKAYRSDALYGDTTLTTNVGPANIDYSSMKPKAETMSPSDLFARNKKAFDSFQEQFSQGLIDEETARRLIETLNKQLANNNIQMRFDLDTTDIDKARKKIANTIGLIDDMGSSLSQMGSAMGVPELDSAGLIAGAIASIIQGYGTATAQASSMGPWAWIAFAIAGAATMASVVAQINSMKGFADGGVINGSRTIGDYNLAKVNSGEMILNGTSQKKLFNLINNGGMVSDSGSQSVTEVRVKGSDLYLALSNYKKSSPGRKAI